jgi:hypothetical protein
VKSGTQYVIVAPPPGAVVYAVPASTTVVYSGETKYYYDGGTYYVLTDAKAEKPPPGTDEPADSDSASQADASAKSDTGDETTTIKPVEMSEAPEEGKNYKTVAPPVGATVPYLPDDAKEKTIDGKKYWQQADTYYQAFVSGGDTIYMVVKNPKA